MRVPPNAKAELAPGAGALARRARDREAGHVEVGQHVMVMMVVVVKMMMVLGTVRLLDHQLGVAGRGAARVLVMQRAVRSQEGQPRRPPAALVVPAHILVQGVEGRASPQTGRGGGRIGLATEVEAAGRPGEDACEARPDARTYGHTRYA